MLKRLHCYHFNFALDSSNRSENVNREEISMSILQPHDLESEQFEPAFHFLPLSHSQIKRDMERKPKLQLRIIRWNGLLSDSIQPALTYIQHRTVKIRAYSFSLQNRGLADRLT